MEYKPGDYVRGISVTGILIKPAKERKTWYVRPTFDIDWHNTLYTRDRNEPGLFIFHEMLFDLDLDLISSDKDTQDNYKGILSNL